MNRLRPILLQMSIWCGFAAVIILAHSTLSANRNMAMTVLVRIAELAMLYNAHQILYRRYFVYRQYRMYGVLFVLTLMLCGVALQAYRVWNTHGVVLMWSMPDILREILAAGLFFMVIMGVITFIQRKKNEYAMQEAQQEARALQAASELKMLQAQINPHFLFNTLHSLYTLISLRSEEAQEQAQEVVLMLADLMRYMYKTTNADTVQLSEEVENIERFIALHRVRLGKRAELCFETSGNLDTWHIPSLLLLTFVENSIKHGVEATAKGAYLKAQVNAGEELCFCITNSKASQTISRHDTGHTDQTGLVNVRRRLAILYPHRFDLAITDADNFFSVELRLWRSERRSS